MSISSSARLLSAGFAALALTALGLAAPMSASAAPTTLYVDHANGTSSNCLSPGDGACPTIADAVAVANAGDTISIAAGSYPETVELGMSLTLTGAGTTGADATKVTGDPYGGTGAAFTIAPPSGSQDVPEVTIENLVASGSDHGNGIVVTDSNVHLSHILATASGTGVWVNSGTVTIADSESSHNIGGITTGYSYNPDPSDPMAANVTVTNTTVADNENTGIQVIGDTGTLAVSDSSVVDTAYGVGIDAQGTTTIERTISARNGRGGVGSRGTTTIADAKIEDNHGIGVAIYAGALSMDGSTVSGTVPYDPEVDVPQASAMGVAAYEDSTGTISTSTIYGNTGEEVLSLSPSLTISNSTIGGTLPPTNASPPGDLPTPTAAIATLPLFGPVSLNLSGTIVSGGTDIPACTGDVVDSGYNLDTDGSCQFTAPSLSDADQSLGALADNGGLTKTVLPAKGPAIDAIPVGSAGCAQGVTDQRGIVRPQGERCDIGAVELEQTPITISPDTLPDGTVGTKYSVQLSATGGAGAPYTWALAKGSSLPDGLSLSADGVISGTPATAGTFQVTVSVDDPVTKTYALTIAAADTPVTPPATPPASGGSGGASGGSGGVSGGSGTQDALADTGSNAVAPLGLAVAMFALGGLVLVGTRRLKRTVR